MRVSQPSSAPVSRTSQSQAQVANKPAVETQPAGELRHVPGPIVDFFKPDAKTRAKQGEQLGQIADGTRNGSLTEKETQALLKEQQAIADAQKAAMADGKLTLGEKLKLGMMQSQAQRNIDSAAGNRDRDVFARFDQDAQTQANQIDQIAAGRTHGNITNSEAGKLLGQQASIAGSRDSNGQLGNLLTDFKQSQAQKDIDLHSKPGTQIDLGDLKPLPFPRPLPEPLPFPRPEPRPLPEPMSSRPPFFVA
ncbi:MAG: hypothetical protein JXB05_28715 [Myxococcaceae bacterium]|nr:hypothetical protein [Myxococcaceae bacterium]